jgi:hypothetical protein
LHVKGAWSGHARLQLHAHVNAPWDPEASVVGPVHGKFGLV